MLQWSYTKNEKKLCYVLLFTIIFCGCKRGVLTDNISNNQMQSVETTQLDETITIELGTHEHRIAYKDASIASVYRDVLNNELQFYSTDEQEWTYMNEFDYYDGEQGQEVDPLKFWLVDIDSDGNSEIQMVVTTPEEYPGMGVELLYYEDDKIYGYMLPKWISGGVLCENIAMWDSFWLETAEKRFSYGGIVKISIKNLKLHYTFLFREKGSEEEEWLRDNSSLIENLSIEYVGDMYDEYERVIYTSDEFAEFTKENIDKYIR